MKYLLLSLVLVLLNSCNQSRSNVTTNLSDKFGNQLCISYRNNFAIIYMNLDESLNSVSIEAPKEIITFKSKDGDVETFTFQKNTFILVDEGKTTVLANLPKNYKTLNIWKILPKDIGHHDYGAFAKDILKNPNILFKKKIVR